MVVQNLIAHQSQGTVKVRGHDLQEPYKGEAQAPLAVPKQSSTTPVTLLNKRSTTTLIQKQNIGSTNSQQNGDTASKNKLLNVKKQIPIQEGD